MNATFADHGNDEDNDDRNTEHIFHQNECSHLSNDWLLLDNQSILNQFVNKQYLTNIHIAQKPIIVFCNAGSTYQKGMFGNFLCGKLSQIIT